MSDEHLKIWDSLTFIRFYKAFSFALIYLSWPEPLERIHLFLAFPAFSTWANIFQINISTQHGGPRVFFDPERSLPHSNTLFMLLVFYTDIGDVGSLRVNTSHFAFMCLSTSDILLTYKRSAFRLVKPMTKGGVHDMTAIWINFYWFHDCQIISYDNSITFLISLFFCFLTEKTVFVKKNNSRF